MQALDRALRPPVLDRLRDLLLELGPVVERAQAQELEQRVQLLDVVLHRRAREAPAELRLERVARARALRRPVLDVVRLVCLPVSARHFSTCAHAYDAPRTTRHHLMRKSASFFFAARAAGFLLRCRCRAMSSRSDSDSESAADLEVLPLPLPLPSSFASGA